MRPPNDDDHDAPDEPDDELIAQIVPLRRRPDEADQPDRTQSESQAVDDAAEEWSVFDPPEDLPLTERAAYQGANDRQRRDARSQVDIASQQTIAPRIGHRALAFAGVALTTVAIAAIVVLALKGHAGASEHRRAATTPAASLPITSERMVRQQPLPARHAPTSSRTRIAAPKHRRPSHQTNSHFDRTPAFVGAGSPTTPSHSEAAPVDTQKERSTNSGAETRRGAAAEFGFEQ